MSKAEDLLAFQLTANKIQHTREFKFHKTRRWRIDFLIEDWLAIEIEGVTSWGKNKDGTMRLGRHQTATGIEEDCIKYDEAQRAGLTIYRCTPKMVNNGRAIETIKLLMELRK